MFNISCLVLNCLFGARRRGARSAVTPTVLNALADSSVGADGVQRFGAQHKHSRYGTAVGSKNVVIVAAIVVACEGKSRVLGWNCVCAPFLVFFLLYVLLRIRLSQMCTAEDGWTSGRVEIIRVQYAPPCLILLVELSRVE